MLYQLLYMGKLWLNDSNNHNKSRIIVFKACLKSVFNILYACSLWYKVFSLCLCTCHLFIQKILRKPWVDSAHCQALNEFCITTMNAELFSDPIQRTELQLLECHHLPIYSISPTTSVHTHSHTDGEGIMISMNSVLLFEIITVRAWKGSVVHFSSHWSHCGASPLCSLTWIALFYNVWFYPWLKVVKFSQKYRQTGRDADRQMSDF